MSLTKILLNEGDIQGIPEFFTFGGFDTCYDHTDHFEETEEYKYGNTNYYEYKRNCKYHV